MRYFATKHISRTCLLVACIWAANAVAWAQQSEETRTVEVIGRGRIYRDNVAKAREEAVSDGLWNAVEQGVALLTSPAAVVSHFQDLSDWVYAETEEFIRDYKVITESKSDQYYRLVMQVTLFITLLQEKLEDMGILLPREELPSVLVLLSERNMGQLATRHIWGGLPFIRLPLAAEAAFSRSMREKGFRILDAGTLLNRGVDVGPEYQSPDLSNETAARLGRELAAEIVIVGQASARPGNSASSTYMKSVEAALSARAVGVDGALAYGSSTATATAANPDEEVAGAIALRLAALEVAEDLGSQMATHMTKQALQSIVLELVVKGITEYSDFVAFRTGLKNEMQGVENVHLRTINAGEARMDVDTKGSAHMLARELMSKDFKDFALNIIEVGKDHIELEIVPKPDPLKESGPVHEDATLDHDSLYQDLPRPE